MKEGEFVCNNENLAPETRCEFVCPIGKMPLDETIVTCKENIGNNGIESSYEWDKDVSNFKCIRVMR